MSVLTPVERVAHYHDAFPQYPPTLVASDRWLCGAWVLGNNYRAKAGYYGEYPPEYLERLAALFPDIVSAEFCPHVGQMVMHAFAGAVPAGLGVRIDVNPKGLLRPDVVADVTVLPLPDRCVDLTMADPPYTGKDAARYGVKKNVHRLHATTEIARVTKPGGFLVWLDTTTPMFRKDLWRWWGLIGMARSTNHRVRGVHFFERV